jgi:hypothetical protein
LFAILLSFLCLTIHEIGHAAAGLLCGGQVREFVVLSLVPHVRLTGTFSAAQASWIALAGSTGPLLLFAGMAWAKAGLAFEVTGAFAVIELVGWTVAAAFFPGGPQDNDAWDFLTRSGVSKWGVLATCGVVGVLLWMALRTGVNAPRERRSGARTGTDPVTDMVKETSNVEMETGHAVRFAGGSAFGGDGADAGLEPK